MVYCEERKFIYIAVPKTGTTSVERALVDSNELILRNKLPLSDGQLLTVNKHIAVTEVATILEKRSENFKFFGFIREPKAHVFSRYAYYKWGRGAERARSGASKSKYLYQKVLFARVTPFWLWILLYPLRSQSRFLRNDSCFKLDIELIKYEKLSEGLSDFLTSVDFEITDLNLESHNVSRTNTNAIENWWTNFVVNIRLRQDVRIYKSI